MISGPRKKLLGQSVISLWEGHKSRYAHFPAETNESLLTAVCVQVSYLVQQGAVGALCKLIDCKDTTVSSSTPAGKGYITHCM